MTEAEETREERLNRLEKLRSDESVNDTDRLIRLTRYIASMPTVPPDYVLVAVTDHTGTAVGVSQGDINALVRMQIDMRERIGRIADWHARETGPAGTVGDYCTECAHRWPCPTRKMADGTWTDADEIL